MKSLNIQETILEIENLSKLLKESYVFDEEQYDDMPYEGEDMVDEPSMPSDGDVSNTTDKINQIRSLALDGIQDFAENVESDEYQFYKKVWLLCDKFCESDKSNESVE